MRTLGSQINPSRNTNPYNHNTQYMKLYTSVKDGTSNKDEYGQLIDPQYLDDVFNYEFLFPLARKVKIDRVVSNNGESLQLFEVQVIDYNDTNVALFKNTERSSIHDGRESERAVDGNLNTYYQSGTGEDKKWWYVDLGKNVPVKNVRVYNRTRLPSGTNVSLLDSGDRVLRKYQIDEDIFNSEVNISFIEDTSVVAWSAASLSPTGGPLFTDSIKTEIEAQLGHAMDMFDTSIALVFGNKTTIGQICSFSKGLASQTVTDIPGFCCLDAPYQSMGEEWGAKVSLWDV